MHKYNFMNQTNEPREEKAGIAVFVQYLKVLEFDCLSWCLNLHKALKVLEL